jgi:hypothetical protein
MRKSVYHWLVAALLFAQPPQLRAAESMNCAGVNLPANERMFDVDLVLNGMGIRRVSAFNIQVYVAGLYLERRTKNPADVWPRERTKVMVTTFLRDGDRERLIENFRGSFANQPEPVQKVLHKYQADFGGHKGDRLIFGYGQGRLEMRHNGKLTGTWNDPAFAEALFKVWLGNKPVDAGLKRGLLGGGCD